MRGKEIFKPKPCTDKRPCFAREDGKCMALTETYENTDRACPFCKPSKEQTSGKWYPYNELYGAVYEPKKPKA